MGAQSSSPKPLPLAPVQQPQTSLFAMEPFTADELASIQKIHFRFKDVKIGNKYDADFSYAEGVLFEINDDSGIVPQDVMDRLRETLYILMDQVCTNEAERKKLRAWTQNFTFGNSFDKRMRNSQQVREALADAINSKEHGLFLLVDAGTCNMTTTATSPRARRKTIQIDMDSTDANATPVNPVTKKSVVTKTTSRPPLAPKNLNAKTSVSSQAKKSLKKVLLNKDAAPFSMAKVKATAIGKENTSSSKTSLGRALEATLESDPFLNDKASVVEAVLGEKVQGHDDVDGIDLNALLEGCVGEDDLMFTEPNDYSPLLNEKDEYSNFSLSNIVSGDEESSKAATTKTSITVSDGEEDPLGMDIEDHSCLLPWFFDDAMSLMPTTSDGGFDMECGSSLFKETERTMLQSALDIIGDDTTILPH